MSTYSDASLILPVAPEYKAGKIYSLKPTDGSGDFTVARASKKHRINSDLKLAIIDNNIPSFNFDTIGGCPFLNTEPQATNLITYPITFGNPYWTKSGASIEGDPSTAGAELITVAADRDFSSDTGFWTKGTGWSIGSGLATKIAGTPSSIKNTTLATLVSGTMYKLTFTISNYTGGTLNPYIEGTYYKEISANGTYNAYLVAGTSASSIDFYADIAFAGSIDDVSIKEVQGYSAPSVNFPTSAFKLVESVGGTYHYIIPPAITTTAAPYSFAFYVKASGRNWIYLDLLDNTPTDRRCWFDLSNGVVGTAESGVTGFITPLNDSWYKCAITIDEARASLNYPTLYLADADNSLTYTGDGTSGVYLFMAQFEAGSVATSPTFTDTTLADEGMDTTRFADVVSNLNATSYTDSLSGVLFAEVSALGNSGTYRTLSLNDAIDTNRIEMYYRPDAEKMSFYVNIGGGNIINYTHTFTDATVLHKVAIKWSVGDFGVFVNGVKVNSSNSTAVFTSNVLTKLSFTNSAGGEIFSGNTKQLQVYGTALTDAECITLTTL